MANNCSICGLNMDFVGRSHRCIPTKHVTAIVNTVHGTDYRAADGTIPTYQYRDPDKRRAYMRELMRKRRNGKTSNVLG
ncbi:MAG TPA: hypothetical protein VIY48_05045 [Candidatus Paceibacterota bacterium]